MTSALRRLGAASALALALLPGCGVDRPTAPVPAAGPPLLLGFVSDRPPNPTPFVTDIYLKDMSSPAPAFLVPNVDTPSNEGPLALSGDGRTMAFYTDRFYIGSITTLALYDVETGALHIPGPLKLETNTTNPSLSYDGRYLAYQVQGTSVYDQQIEMIDVAGDTLVNMPNANELGATDFDPAVSGDGKLIAYATNGTRSLGAFDIVLYSVPGDSFIPLPNLNSLYNELSPSLSRDGRYLAFQTGDPKVVKGLIDVEVYDRETQSLLDLPGANTEMAEVQPVISPDGRYLAYTTESQGGRDIRLYDIREKHLVPLSGVNDPTYYDEFPALSELPPVIYRPANVTRATDADRARAAAAEGMVAAHAPGAAAFVGTRRR